MFPFQCQSCCSQYFEAYQTEFRILLTTLLTPSTLNRSFKFQKMSMEYQVSALFPIFEYKFPTVALLLDLHPRAAALQLHSPLLQLHIPPIDIRTQRVSLGRAVSTGVGVDCQVADAAEVVAAGVQAASFELQRPVLELPEAVYQHAEDVHGDLFVALLRNGEQPADAAELALDIPAPGNRRFLLRKAGFAKPILKRRVAILMEPDLAINAMEQRVILLKMRAETGSTCSFEYALVVLATALALLALDVLLELLLVSDQLVLVGVHSPVLLNGVQIGVIVEVVYFSVNQCFSQILLDQTDHVLIPRLVVDCGLLLSLLGYALQDVRDGVIDFALVFAHQVQQESHL